MSNETTVDRTCPELASGSKVTARHQERLAMVYAGQQHQKDAGELPASSGSARQPRGVQAGS